MTVVEQLRALLAKATPGPWGRHVVGDFGHVWLVSGPDDAFVAEKIGPNDAELIAAMHAALPALLDVAEAAGDFFSLSKGGSCTGFCNGVCAQHRLQMALAKLSDSMVPNVIGDEK